MKEENFKILFNEIITQCEKEKVITTKELVDLIVHRLETARTTITR